MKITDIKDDILPIAIFMCSSNKDLLDDVDYLTNSYMEQHVDASENYIRARSAIVVYEYYRNTDIFNELMKMMLNYKLE